MKPRRIFGAFWKLSRRSRMIAPLVNSFRRSAARASSQTTIGASANAALRGNAPSALHASARTPMLRRRGQESGYAFLFVLG